MTRCEPPSFWKWDKGREGRKERKVKERNEAGRKEEEVWKEGGKDGRKEGRKESCKDVTQKGRIEGWKDGRM